MEEGKEKLIPKINKKISDFLYEEEGNISRGKILTVGSLLLIAGIIFADEVYGAHRSHSSHSSHSYLSVSLNNSLYNSPIIFSKSSFDSSFKTISIFIVCSSL